MCVFVWTFLAGGWLRDLIHDCAGMEDDGESMRHEGAYTRADDCFQGAGK